jgi:glycosyltransferase involved in cell wall biosynthesis
MSAAADVCLIAEGGYPYVVGGVASWVDALMRASPHLNFHIIAITTSSQARQLNYVLPANAVDVTDVILDVCPRGRTPARSDAGKIRQILQLVEIALTSGDSSTFEELTKQMRTTGFGQAALLDSKEGWHAMEKAYGRLLPNGPLLDFFWSWRFLVRSLLAVVSTPLPKARVFHAAATGFSGLVGSYAKLAAKMPFLVTEHGIYTNERRMELAVSDSLFDSQAGGFDVAAKSAELRSIWLNAFQSFSRISYGLADVITTMSRVNQSFQRADGATDDKLRIIPNGIDTTKFAAIPRDPTPRPPTVVMIGRIVPIKDIRTFIIAIALLKDLVPNVLALVVGPEDEDPEYAASCHQLVQQLGAESSIEFLGSQRDVRRYLSAADVLALSSISEGQPMVVLEAAATGLPIVSTDVGSCREIIEGFDGDPVDGRGGIVVEPCNPMAIAEALATILLDDALRSQMAEVMRRRVASYYHKDRVTRLYEGLYAELAPPAPRIDPESHDQHQ